MTKTMSITKTKWTKLKKVFHSCSLVKKPPGSWRDPAKNPDPHRDPAGILPARVFSRQDPVRIPSGQKSRHRSRRDSHRESSPSPGSRQESRLPRDPAGILPTRVFSRRDSVRKKIPP